MSYQDYIDRQNQQLMEDLFGRGEGDPDHWGHPHEHDADCQIHITGKGSTCDCSYKEGSHENIGNQ